jgi:hypothetical protein
MAQARQDLEAWIGRPWSHEVSVLRLIGSTDNGTVAFRWQITTFRAGDPKSPEHRM